MKIYAYGCSFTDFKWPTYADILGLQFHVINRGASGSGNERIFFHFMEDVRENKIDSQDTVIFQWSGLTRFDYLQQNNTWLSVGNVLNQYDTDGNYIYTKIKEWLNPNYEFEKTVNYKISSEFITKELGCQSLQMSLSPIEGHDRTFIENNLSMNYQGDYNFYHQPWVENNKENSSVDIHPTVIQHYNLARKIAKELSLELNIDENKIRKLHNLIINKKDYRLDYSFNDL